MRVYYVHLQPEDFTLQVGSSFQSGVIDLYNNKSYTNYSLVRSRYGLNADGSVLGDTGGNGVWVGLRWLDGTHTNTGYISGHRYVDTSGAVNLVSYEVDASSYGSSVTLDVYQSNHPDGVFPDEWAPAALARQSQDGLADLANSFRYIVLVLNFNYFPGPFDFYLRVEIDGPVMAPRYAKTGDLLLNLPSWMAMREASTTATPSSALAAPTSLGGAIVNAIAGEWLEDIGRQLDYRKMQLFIDTVDTTQMAWCWKSAHLPANLNSIVGDGVHLSLALDANEFYEAQSQDDIAYWDENTDTLYTNRHYSQLSLNGISYSQGQHRVWNSLDDLGLLVSLPRLPGEGNISFQSRIRDVYINPLGVGKEQFQLSLRRELNLWSVYGSTPDSSYVGATPTVLELSDLETDSIYVDPDGMPTDKFTHLVDYMAREFPITWGNFYWNKSYWDVGGTADYSGFAVLPNRMDANPLPDSYTQSGVGDGTDLCVLPPAVLGGARDISVRMVVRGKQRSSPQTQYPPVTVPFSVVGQAQRPIYTNPPTSSWVTIYFMPGTVLNLSDANLMFCTFLLTATSDVDVNQVLPTAASYVSQRIFDADGATDPDLNLFYYVSHLPVERRLLATEVAQVQVYIGQMDPNTFTIDNLPAASTIKLWVSTDPFTILAHVLAESPYLTITNPHFGATPGTAGIPNFSVVMSSQVTSVATTTWSSESLPGVAIINDTTTTGAQLAGTVSVPGVNWDAYLAATPGKQYVVTLTGPININNFDGSVTVLDSSHVALNGSTSWDGNLSQTISGSVTSLVFTVISSGSYPVTGYTWSLFEYQQLVAVGGAVDENGPWRNGVQPYTGNNNYTFALETVGRADFGLPTTSSYVPQWIGAVSSDPSVIVWLNNNSVTEDQAYGFGTYTVYARLAPDLDPVWNPQINSGAFYEGHQEYYLFAEPFSEVVTDTSAPLSHMVRQGAPIVVTSNEANPQYSRQVAFFDWETTPASLGLFNTEVVKGTGTNQLYMSFDNLYAISVVDVTDPFNPVSVPAHNTAPSQVVVTNILTDKTRSYKVTYKLVNSFYVDNDYSVGATPLSYIAFDSANSNGRIVTYELSLFNPATPVSVALSPFATTLEEGFIFLSHQEYTLDHIETHISPNRIEADGQDYLLLSIHAEDVYGNPKAYQTFHLTTNFGSFDNAIITTGKDGFAVATLTAGTESQPTPPHVVVPHTVPQQSDYFGGFMFGGSEWATPSTPLIAATPGATPSITAGLITITGPGGYNTTVPFVIDVLAALPYHLLAMCGQNEIRANGTDLNVVYGRIQDTNFNNVYNAIILWKKARSNYDLFSPNGILEDSGEVFSDANGGFTIGPFTAATVPGYQFVAIESSQAGNSTFYDTVGEVVFWYEQPTSNYGVEQMSGLSPMATQLATPTWVCPPYSSTATFPVYYDEQVASSLVVAATPNWLPPSWYPLPYYVQYQLGIALPGVAYNNYPAIDAYLPLHPYEGQT